MESDVNLYEEIVKLNMRISCLEALLYDTIDRNPNLNFASGEEIDHLHSVTIQSVIDELEE